VKEGREGSSHTYWVLVWIEVLVGSVLAVLKVAMEEMSQ
jgi:hypothetical protein